jgi:hypothetical protein
MRCRRQPFAEVFDMKMLYAIAITLSMGGFCSAGLITLAKSDMPAPVVRATFNADGTVVLPTGYRRWTHVGTRLKAQGINILDGKPTKGPEIFNAYVEPGAMDVLEHTGKWPDGTQIAKEFSSVRTGEGCDATTGYCTGPLGVGIFEAGYVGLGMMVKDAERFPNSGGHWGYFSFGHQPPPYALTAAANPREKCEACHIALASDTDYVISRAHIGLSDQGR